MYRRRTGKAQALLDEATADLDGPYERGLAKRVEGGIRLGAEQPADAAPVLLAAAAELAGVDRGLARDTLMDALIATGITSRFSAPGADVNAVARAVRAIPISPGASPTPGDLLLDAYATYILDGPGAAAPQTQRALATLDRAIPARLSSSAGWASASGWPVPPGTMSGACASQPGRG